MTQYKKVLKSVRFEADAVATVPEIIRAFGLKEDFSDFTRMAVDERIRRLKEMPVQVVQP